MYDAAVDDTPDPMIIVGGVGCCVCLFAAASGLATGGTKKQKPRASSYKLEAGKRKPTLPESDDDTDERPAAAVSRALEKLDDEEEPPAYDFTPDKAKPAKHRSSVEVDELWPAAGAGAGDQRVQGAGKRHGLRLGLGPGQPHLSARAHVVAPSAYLHNAASPAPPESLVRAIYSPGRHT